MSQYDQLKNKLGYIPDLAKSDLSVFRKLSASDISLIIDGQPNKEALSLKSEIYRRLLAAEKAFDTCAELDATLVDKAEALGSMITDIEFVNGQVFLKGTLKKEISIYENLFRVSTTLPVSKSVSTLVERLPHYISIDENQRRCLSNAFCNRISLICGGPGTGKTTVAKLMVSTLIDSAAFTIDEIAILGSTNKCLSAYSDINAQVSTVHKALGYNPFKDTFSKNSTNKLKYKVILVDEASMLDLPTFSALFGATPDDCHVVLIGDHQQLGSVGLGDVFFDLTTLELGGLLPKVKLMTNRRSNDEINQVVSAISGNKTILNGKMNSVNFVACSAVDSEYYNKLLKILLKFQTSGYSVLHDLQMLAPKYTGTGGIDEINRLVHIALTPNNFPIDVGDKITFGKTTTSFYQGEQGFVSEVSICGGALGVANKRITTPVFIKSISQPRLSHCMSIHDSQGSEWDHGLLCMHRDDISWLGKRGLITAVSRFRASVTFYGDISLADLLSAPEKNRKTLASIFSFNSVALLDFIKRSI